MVNSFKSVNNEECFFKKYASGEECCKSKLKLEAIKLIAPAKQNIYGNSILHQQKAPKKGHTKWLNIFFLFQIL